MRGLRTNKRRGQAMTEFALIAPIFFVMILFLVDVARVIYYYDVISNAAREGAREAILEYNQCSNQTPGATAGTPPVTCSTPPNGTGVTIVGVDPAMDRVTGGALKFQFANTTSDTGTPPPCTPAPNRGCVWVFEVGSGTPNSNGPDPTDPLQTINYNSLKAGGNHDIRVEIEYNFTPFTPMISRILGNNTILWAKSQMRAEY